MGVVNDRKVERLSSMPAVSMRQKWGFGTSRYRLSDQATPLTSVRGRGPGVIFLPAHTLSLK